MKRLKTALLKALLCCAFPFSTHAISIELQAITDFNNLTSGEIPYYIDTVAQRNVLAINAANPDYREKFARAEHTFTGADGLYDITINALGEIDGDCVYQLLVNGEIIGTSVNHPVEEDYEIIEHLFQGVALNAQDIVAVESNAVSNDTIPEGDGFAFARGRWKNLTINEQNTNGETADTSVDLELSLTASSTILVVGDEFDINISAKNLSNTNVATAPGIELALPAEFEFVSSDICTASATNSNCTLANLAPEDIATATLKVRAIASGTVELMASVSADQADNTQENNSTVLSIEIQDETVVIDNTPDENDEEENGDDTDNSGADTDSSNDESSGSEANNNGGSSDTSEQGDNQITDSSTIPTATTTTDTSSTNGGGTTGAPALIALTVFLLMGRRRSSKR